MYVFLCQNSTSDSVDKAFETAFKIMFIIIVIIN